MGAAGGALGAAGMSSLNNLIQPKAAQPYIVQPVQGGGSSAPQPQATPTSTGSDPLTSYLLGQVGNLFNPAKPNAAAISTLQQQSALGLGIGANTPPANPYGINLQAQQQTPNNYGVSLGGN